MHIVYDYSSDSSTDTITLLTPTTSEDPWSDIEEHIYPESDSLGERSTTSTVPTYIGGIKFYLPGQVPIQARSRSGGGGIRRRRKTGNETDHSCEDEDCEAGAEKGWYSPTSRRLVRRMIYSAILLGIPAGILAVQMSDSRVYEEIVDARTQCRFSAYPSLCTSAINSTLAKSLLSNLSCLEHKATIITRHLTLLHKSSMMLSDPHLYQYRHYPSQYVHPPIHISPTRKALYNIVPRFLITTVFTVRHIIAASTRYIFLPLFLASTLSRLISWSINFFTPLRIQSHKARLLLRISSAIERWNLRYQVYFYDIELAIFLNLVTTIPWETILPVLLLEIPISSSGMVDYKDLEGIDSAVRIFIPAAALVWRWRRRTPKVQRRLIQKLVVEALSMIYFACCLSLASKAKQGYVGGKGSETGVGIEVGMRLTFGWVFVPVVKNMGIKSWKWWTVKDRWTGGKWRPIVEEMPISERKMRERRKVRFET